MRPLSTLALVLLGWLAFACSAAAATSPFAGWAAVVVAGDWHAHSGGPSEAFDNARHDVGKALLAAGFRPENLREFSVRPARYHPRPEHSDLRAIYDSLGELGARAPDGCLVYFSSHGAPSGVVVDDRLLSPALLRAMLDDTCKDRPTIVVVSACFSGVFVPVLAGRNRMVLTAARPDRTSFGCGESDRYPYFDDCFLKNFSHAHDFIELGREVQACVAEREVETGMSPPSEPQLSVGSGLRPLLPLYPLTADSRSTAAF
jgi:hypothetical protein